MTFSKSSMKFLASSMYLIWVGTVIIFITTIFTWNIKGLSAPLMGSTCVLSLSSQVYTKSAKVRKAFKLFLITYILYSPMALYFGLTGPFPSILFLLGYLLIVFANIYMYKSLKEKKIEEFNE